MLRSVSSSKKTFCAPLLLTLINVVLQDFEVVDNEESAEWEKEIEDMLGEENDIQ